MGTLRLKNSLRITVHLQEFIVLKFNKEEVIISMIKDDQYFHQMQIFIKMTKPLLIFLIMADSNHPHIHNLWFMVIMVDDQIRMSMPEINGDEYFPPVTEL